MSQSLNDSIVLPFSRFHHFADFAFHQVALEGADVADVELPVQMIGLVEEGTGEQLFSSFFVDFAMDVLSADGDSVGARDVLAEIWNAEASFTLGMAAFSVNNFGFDEDKF